MKQIAFINFNLPTGKSYGHINSFNFWDKRSLADFDIICITPDWDFGYHQLDSRGFNGKQLLNETWSAKFWDLTSFWRNELARAVNSKKTLLIFMEGCDDFYYYTGNKEFSGTGRNRKATNIVNSYHPYDIFGGLKLKKPEFGKGMQISLSAKASPPIQDFWKVIEKYSSYEAYFDKTSFDTEIILTQKKGDGVVGGIYHYKLGGKLVVLPVLDRMHQDFITRKTNKRTGEEKSEWSELSNQFCGDFLSALVAVHESFKEDVQEAADELPVWLKDEFFLQAHTEKNSEIQKNEDLITGLKDQISKLNTDIKELSKFYNLLYGTGKPLEEAVRESLKLIGYKVSHYDDGVSEYDAVFESDGDLFLGEVEGKEGQIDVKKISQLIRNVVEYISNHDQIPKGILFGNALRKVDPLSRQNEFTEKCIKTSAAQNIGLINTSDLFSVTKHLLENNDEEFKASIRESIKNTKAGVVQFPKPKNKS